jgi:hypothetical protein
VGLGKLNDIVYHYPLKMGMRAEPGAAVVRGGGLEKLNESHSTIPLHLYGSVG